MNTTKPKIAIIGRGLENGGVLRYLHNLLLELDKCQTLDFYFIHTERIIQIDFKNIKSIYVETKSKLWFDYVTSFFLVKKYKFDLVIYPKNVIPTTHYLLSCKKMNVVYDLGYFEKSLNAYPFLDTLFMTTFMKQSCKGADATISISQSTKDDIVKRFGTKSEKINPILLAVEDNFKVIPETQADKQFFDKLNIKKPYLFFAGSVNPRKNMERTIKAFMSIADKIPHTIVMTGFNNWTSEEELYKNPRIQMVGFRSEEELITLYNHADLFLYASLYEGFGLPIIEAQACGCPVLTSNVTSCPEVAGDSALIVNPYSVEEIADGILKILTDEEYRQKLIHLGFENLKRFSWEKNAQQTIELIHSLVG